MTIGEAKKYVRDFVAGYFGDSHVSFAEQKQTRPTVPYITLRFGKSGKKRGKITMFDDKDQCYKDFWQRKISLEINLYTAGRNVAEKGYDPVYENTCIEDMEDFISYIMSDYGSDELVSHDVAIVQEGDVQDLSALLNDSSYRYRSMAQFYVLFTDCSFGKYGQNGVLTIPNPSGGGTKDMIADSDTIEKINIKGGIIKDE